MPSVRGQGLKALDGVLYSTLFMQPDAQIQAHIENLSMLRREVADGCAEQFHRGLVLESISQVASMQPSGGDVRRSVKPVRVEGDKPISCHRGRG